MVAEPAVLTGWCTEVSSRNGDFGYGSKQEILRRIRSALRDVPSTEQPEDVAIQRKYRTLSDTPREDVLNEFAARVAEYRATVHRIRSSELRGAIAAACTRQKVRRLIVPSDTPPDWLPDDLAIWRDHIDAPRSNEELDSSDGVLTGCAVGIAQTGTIILDAGRTQGRRALTLVPDCHLCVVLEHQVVGLVPEAVRQIGDTVRRSGRPVTLISGPSATSDIEFNRVEGVHGPRRLEVFLVGN